MEAVERRVYGERYGTKHAEGRPVGLVEQLLQLEKDLNCSALEGMTISCRLSRIDSFLNLFGTRMTLIRKVLYGYDAMLDRDEVPPSVAGYVGCVIPPRGGGGG